MALRSLLLAASVALGARGGAASGADATGAPPEAAADVAPDADAWGSADATVEVMPADTATPASRCAVAPADPARNPAALQRVVEQAASRGIRVGLMTYRSDTDPLGLEHQPLPDDRRARFAFAAPLPEGASVRLLWKPIDARVDWRPLAARGEGGAYEATIPGDAGRVLVAAEVSGASSVARSLPDPRERTPYWLFERR